MSRRVRLVARALEITRDAPIHGGIVVAALVTALLVDGDRVRQLAEFASLALLATAVMAVVDAIQARLGPPPREAPLAATVMPGRRPVARAVEAAALLVVVALMATVDSGLLAGLSGIAAGTTLSTLITHRRLRRLERETGRVTYRRLGLFVWPRTYVGGRREPPPRRD